MMALVKVEHDFEAVDFAMLGIRHSADAWEAADILSRCLTERMSKVGGKGEVEITNQRVAVVWDPEPLEGLTDRGRVETVNFAHLVQAGMLEDPSRQLAGTVYQGRGDELSLALLSMHMYRLDEQMILRDAFVMTQVAPLYSIAWMTCGIIHLDVGFRKTAKDCFAKWLEVKPGDHIAMKYLALCDLVGKPTAAVRWIEASLEVAAEKDLLPGIHERTTYGMALLAAKSVRDAMVQFDLMGVPRPVMTPREWGKWGYQLPPRMIEKALRDPAAGEHYLKWWDRGENKPG